LISAVILAAGLSKRMGSPKQEVLLAGRKVLDYVVDSFLSSKVTEVVVVVRPGLAWRRSARKLKIVLNENPSSGISGSLVVGLGVVHKLSKAVVVGLGDKPLVLPSSINALISEYEASGSKIVIPTYGGTRGNPVLFDRSLFPMLLRLHGDSGAKSVIERYPEKVRELPLADEGIVIDVNTPGDIEGVSRKLRTRSKSARE
jgi:molybdenum cofactor cytidylyltransferase